MARQDKLRLWPTSCICFDGIRQAEEEHRRRSWMQHQSWLRYRSLWNFSHQQRQKSGWPATAVQADDIPWQRFATHPGAAIRTTKDSIPLIVTASASSTFGRPVFPRPLPQPPISSFTLPKDLGWTPSSSFQEEVLSPQREISSQGERLGLASPPGNPALVLTLTWLYEPFSTWGNAIHLIYNHTCSWCKIPLTILT